MLGPARPLGSHGPGWNRGDCPRTAAPWVLAWLPRDVPGFAGDPANPPGPTSIHRALFYRRLCAACWAPLSLRVPGQCRHGKAGAPSHHCPGEHGSFPRPDHGGDGVAAASRRTCRAARAKGSGEPPPSAGAPTACSTPRAQPQPVGGARPPAPGGARSGAERGGPCRERRGRPRGLARPRPRGSGHCLELRLLDRYDPLAPVEVRDPPSLTRPARRSRDSFRGACA